MLGQVGGGGGSGGGAVDSSYGWTSGALLLFSVCLFFAIVACCCLLFFVMFAVIIINILCGYLFIIYLYWLFAVLLLPVIVCLFVIGLTVVLYIIANQPHTSLFVLSLWHALYSVVDCIPAFPKRKFTHTGKNILWIRSDTYYSSSMWIFPAPTYTFPWIGLFLLSKCK